MSPVKETNVQENLLILLGQVLHTLREADPVTVPRTEPVVVGTRVIMPNRLPDGVWAVGGRVLELCGRDGRNQPYYSEMLVFGDGDRLISTGTVFWIGVRIASDPAVGSAPAPPASCPA